MIKGYCVEGVYTTSESTCEEAFLNEADARDYYEKLILELKEEYGDQVNEVIDYITIYYAESNDEEITSIDELGVANSIYNIETYTYDLPE
jgi:predicted solute-binding protein